MVDQLAGEHLGDGTHPHSELSQGHDFLPSRAGHEPLAGRPHVWLPVPERLQPSVDPALHEAAREAPCDHRDGGVQPGAAARLGAGGRGRTLLSGDFGHSQLRWPGHTLWGRKHFLLAGAHKPAGRCLQAPLPG